MEWMIFLPALLVILAVLGAWVWHRGLEQVLAAEARKDLWSALAVAAYAVAVAALIAVAAQYWSTARTWLPWAASAAILAGFLLWGWLDVGRPRLTGEGRMQLWKAALLVVYLVAITVASTYALYGLWQADPQLTMQVPPDEPKCGNGTPSATDIPVIQNLDPKKLFIGTDRTNILVLGCNFLDKDTVTFNGEVRNAQFINNSHLQVSLSSSDFRSPGRMAIKVARPAATAGGKPLESKEEATLTIDAAGAQTAKWQFLGWWTTITQELRLLLLVVFAGTLGSCVYSLKSLADFLGTKKLGESWFTFYIVQPFEGGGLAILFYFLIRGGFLAGTNADVKAVNPFGICAIAALVGVFSDLAFAKLREIFLTLFKPVDDRGDKIAAGLTISTQSPLPDATKDADYNQPLQATGGKTPYTWEAAPELPSGLKLENGVVTGKPTAAKARAKYTFKVTDAAGASATAELELEVKDAAEGGG